MHTFVELKCIKLTKKKKKKKKEAFCPSNHAKISANSKLDTFNKK